jgi:hypothetical protein
MTAYFETGSKIRRGRGMAQESLELIIAMRKEAAAAQPITGRGVGYKLFARGLTPSMEKNVMQRVYRLLKQAREQGTIPWEWIVDETRSLERKPSWDDPRDFFDSVMPQYRRNRWDQQPTRVEVWSEKGTVRGVLAPVLNAYGVGFRVMHGFSGATTVHDVAEDDDGRELIALYVGDLDPSGMFMSECDLPKRLEKYGGTHVTVKRVALVREHVRGLLSFPASDKRDDPRYRWFVENHGAKCWELDAMDPNDLRALVQEAVEDEICDRDAWDRCKRVELAERESMTNFVRRWKGAP